MKLLGLIGGMSAESTAIYYQLLNRLVRERLASCARTAGRPPFVPDDPLVGGFRAAGGTCTVVEHALS